MLPFGDAFFQKRRCYENRTLTSLFYAKKSMLMPVDKGFWKIKLSIFFPAVFYIQLYYTEVRQKKHLFGFSLLIHYFLNIFFML